MPCNIPMTLPEGCIKRIHVNQQQLRRRVSGESKSSPCYTVKHKGQTWWCNEVQLHGPSKLVERIDNPLSCGARLWVETTGEVTLVCVFSQENEG